MYGPNVALYYSGWEEPFKTTFADEAYARGAWPFVQIDPVNVSLASIAAGDFDSYLQSYADQVANFGHGVIIGFGHEMNGTWNSWGRDAHQPRGVRRGVAPHCGLCSGSKVPTM